LKQGLPLACTPPFLCRVQDRTSLCDRTRFAPGPCVGAHLRDTNSEMSRPAPQRHGPKAFLRGSRRRSLRRKPLRVRGRIRWRQLWVRKKWTIPASTKMQRIATIESAVVRVCRRCQKFHRRLSKSRSWRTSIVRTGSRVGCGDSATHIAIVGISRDLGTMCADVNHTSGKSFGYEPTWMPCRSKK
jgi:hypothetical protein